MYVGCKDAARFSMAPHGAQATAMWTTYTSQDHSRQGKLEMHLLEDTEPGTEYTICFNVTNPAVGQSAPNIDMLIKQREVRQDLFFSSSSSSSSSSLKLCLSCVSTCGTDS